MKLSLSIEDTIAILAKYNLNPTELFIARLILLAQESQQEDYLFDYMQLPIECRGDIREAIISMQNKGVITKQYKIPDIGETFNPGDITFAINFTKNFHRAAKDMGKELFEHYPQFAHIKGKVVAIRSVSKKFDSLEDFYRFYGKSINWNDEVHHNILDLIDWAKDNTNEFINCSLVNFVIDKRYLDIQALKDGKLVNVNFDAIQMV